VEKEKERERERKRVTQQPYALSFTQRPQRPANNTTVRPQAGVMHWRYHKNPFHFLTNREFKNQRLISKPILRRQGVLRFGW